jgi:hypothetical protein
MNLLFVTGSNSGFFSSLLVGTRSPGEAPVRHGICRRAADTIEGFRFVTLQG